MGVKQNQQPAGLSPNRSSKQIHKSMYFSDLDGLLHRCLFSVPGGQARPGQPYMFGLFLRPM